MVELGVGIGPNAQEVWVTAALFGGCEPLLELYNKTVGKKNRYKFELESDEHDIAFKMIRNNASKVAQQLDVIRREPKKFICLNDNIDHRKKSASKVVEALSNFYTSLFPVRSQFELPLGLRNRFLHVEELRAWRQRQKRIVWWSQLAMGLLLLLILCSLYGTNLKRLRRKWFPNPFGRPRQRTTAGGATLPSSDDGRKLM
jgi:UDP-N-acetylglucosamine-lysosomal-enzyme